MTGRPQWYTQGLDHVWLPYTQMKTDLPPWPIRRTDGVRLYLEDGTTLVDGIASWWVAAHGYNHPHIIGAVEAQLRDMPHAMIGGFLNEPAARLATRLAALMPGDLNRVFFAESGSVAVEVAMKMAVQYFHNRGQAGKTRFINFRDGYHGDTAAAMSVCDPDEGMHGMFKGYLPEQVVADLPRDEAGLAALERLIVQHLDQLAAIIVEPLVQGAGGMKFHEPTVIRRLRSLADRHGLLLILDEIFTGFGRTGSMFAHEQARVVPDMVTLSKALTGGVMPLSAVVARDKVYEAFLDDDPEKCLMHGPTFMGHAASCAAANASLDLFENEPRLDQVKAIGEQMEAELGQLRGHPNVADVRVKGAVGVVQLRQIGDIDALKAAFIRKGVWIRPFRDIIYLAPPFVIGEADLALLTGAIRDVIG